MIGSNKTYDTELVIVRDYTKEDKKPCKPYFAFSQKQGDQWSVTRKDDRFSGNLKSFKVKDKYDLSKPKQKEMAEKYGNSKVVLLTLEDTEAKQTYRWEFSFRLATRSFLNRLFSLESPENIEISIWSTEENGAIYEKLSVRQNGELVKMKYAKEDIPAVKQVKLNGKPMNDYEEINQFFIDKISEFGAGPKPTPYPEKAEKVKTAKKEDGESEDEIPF